MSVSIQQISYIHPGKEVLFSDLSFAISKGQKLGLVGDSECGKSTLLQIIAGRLSPSSGIIVRPDDLYYILQHFGQYDLLTIAQVLQTERKQQVLHAILSGDASNKNFVILDNDWNIEERSIAALDLWELGQFTLSYPMSLFSDGKKTRVSLAGMDIHHPSVVLMGEPTNHLDSSGRQRLYDQIEKYRSILLMVSRGRTLLNPLSEIYELEKHQINYYSKNCEFYKGQKMLMQEALQQRTEEKEKALHITRKVAHETVERRDKQNVRGEESNIREEVPRIILSTFQGESEKSTSKLTGIHREGARKLTNERSQLRGSLSSTAVLKTNFSSSPLHTGEILMTAKEISFSYHSNSVNDDILTNNEINSSDTGYLPNPSNNDIQENSILKQQLWQVLVSFQLKSRDHFRIEGASGSERTTLLKLITGQLQPQEGALTRAGFSYVYLNQEYSIIDDQNSILEQAYTFNSRNLPEHEIKITLHRYLFPVSEWGKSCRKLSSDEEIRLTSCCLMINSSTPDIFILDEPTNNLNIQSIEIITATAKNYVGAVIAISHDNYFVQEIGVRQCILLSQSINILSRATAPIFNSYPHSFE